MSLNLETDRFEQSTSNTNELNSKSDEEGPNQKQQDSIDFLIVTRTPEEIYKFQWIIRQFSKLSTDTTLYSTGIHALDSSWYRLKLVKYEDGFGLFHVFKMESNKHITQYEKEELLSYNRCEVMERVSYTHVPKTKETEAKSAPTVSDSNLKLEYHISARNSRGKNLIKWSVCFSDSKNSETYKIGEYMSNISENFPNDTLILECCLKVSLIPTTEEITVASKRTLESSSWNKLSTDLKALYQNSQDTDVTLIVGAKKIRAHKLILTVRSAIFKKIFHHDMAEAEQNSVTITDVQFSALQRLVEFLYTGIIVDGENKTMDVQELYELYYAADKYEVMDLREMVGNTLFGRIQVDSASEILIWADRHNDKSLKSRTMNFVRLNFETVSNTDTWESCALHHSRLAAEVVNFCSKKLKTIE